MDVLRSSDRSKLFLPGLVGFQDRRFLASSQCSDQFKSPEKVPSRVADLEFSSRGHLPAIFFIFFLLSLSFKKMRANFVKFFPSVHQLVCSDMFPRVAHER